MDAIKSKAELIKLLVEEKRKGNIVLTTLGKSLGTMPVSKFIKQPIDGILYDLNLLEEVASVRFETIEEHIQQYATTFTLRELKAKISSLEEENERYKKAFNSIPLHLLCKKKNKECDLDHCERCKDRPPLI